MARLHALPIVRRVIVAAVCCCAAPSPGAAQDAAGLLAGRVTDEAGAPLAAVEVTARSRALVGLAATSTVASGDYVIRRLPPGEYVVTFESADRVTVKRTTRVAAGQRVVADATLVMARRAEAITVTIDDTTRDRRSGSTTASNETLRVLPLGGHPLGTLRLSPGVVSPVSGRSQFIIGRTRVRYAAPVSLPPIAAGLEEVTVAAHDLGPEVGWLSGGSLTIVATPGSDRYSGEARAVVGGAPFLSDLARSAMPVDGMSTVAEVAFAGPLRPTRTWLAGAASGAAETTRDRLDAGGAAFSTDTGRSLLRASLTHAFSDRHRVAADALRIGGEITAGRDTPAARVLEARALSTRDDAVSAGTATYDGLVRGAVSATARVSVESARSRPAGETPAGVAGGTAVIDQTSGGLWWAPDCAACDATRGRRDEWRLSVGGLLGSPAGGHEWTAGYEGFRDRREPGSEPGGTFRLRTTAAPGGAASPLPRFARDGSTWIEWTSAPLTLSVVGHSLFLADRWRWRGATTLAVGARWDRLDVTTGASGGRTWTEQAFSPRVSISWSPDPHSPWMVTGGLARYVDASVFSPFGVTFASPGTLRTYAYGGPAINSGVTGTGEAVDLALASFFAGGGVSGAPLFALAAAPGDDAPGPTATTELTVGVDRRLGIASSVRADVFWRDFGRIPALAVEPGRTTTDAFGFAVDEARPVSDVFTRRHAGLAIQARYRLGIQAHLGASYALTRLWGNVDASLGPGGTVGESASAYRAYSDAIGLTDAGDLRDDVRHRLRLWGHGDLLVSESIGTITGAIIQEFNSGSPYGAVGLIDVRPFVANPGFANPPAAVPYAFTARDAFRGKPLSRTDLAVSWVRRMPGTVFGQMFVQVHALNLFDKTRPIDAASGAVVRTAFSDPDRFVPFDPAAGGAVRGVHWDFDPRWQDAQSAAATTLPRAFRLSFGVRF